MIHISLKNVLTKERPEWTVSNSSFVMESGVSSGYILYPKEQH